MHIFEDCCGGSLEKLRSNLLYPLFPNVSSVHISLDIICLIMMVFVASSASIFRFTGTHNSK